MPRKSSIHFAPVTNIKFAVSHSERTELSEPGYLLPKEHQLPNIVVAGSLSETDLAELFIKQKESMTGQAKARGSSPFWEGVVVLKNTDGQEQSEYLKAWKVAYEKATGHQVLHMSIHLDEGYIDTAGAVHYNPHAHVIVSRMNEKNRVIELKRKQLGEVQDLTAEILQMERGSTLEERGGKRGRAHIGHKEFRLMADESRLDLEKPKADLARLQKKSKEWSDADLSKIKDLQAKLDGEPARQAAALAAQKLQLDEQYRQDRAALKASGEAKQADYQALKKAHDGAIEALKESNKKVTALTQENQRLQTENERLEAISRITLKTLEVDFGVDIKPAEKLKGEDLERWREAAEDKVFEQQLAEMKPPAPAKRPAEAQKRPVEAPKTPKAPSPSPIQEKSLVARFEASYRAFLDWIKGKNGVVVDLDTQQSDHFGPVVQLDDLHAVQSTGRGRYAVHELGKLDQVPALNDSRTEVHYRGGVGQVKGQSLGRGGRAD